MVNYENGSNVLNKTDNKTYQLQEKTPEGAWLVTDPAT